MLPTVVHGWNQSNKVVVCSHHLHRGVDEEANSIRNKNVEETKQSIAHPKSVTAAFQNENASHCAVSEPIICEPSRGCSEPVFNIGGTVKTDTRLRASLPIKSNVSACTVMHYFPEEDILGEVLQCGRESKLLWIVPFCDVVCRTFCARTGDARVHLCVSMSGAKCRRAFECLCEANTTAAHLRPACSNLTEGK